MIPADPRHKIPVGDRLALAGRSVAYKDPDVYWTGPINPTATLTSHGVRVQFQGCAANGIQLHETTGFEVRSSGVWRAAPVVPNATSQVGCAVDLDLAASEGAKMVRYSWYRSTCFANETKKAVCGSEGCGAGRCAVYSGSTGAGMATAAAAAAAIGPPPQPNGTGSTPNSSWVPDGLPAPPFMIPVVA